MPKKKKIFLTPYLNFVQERFKRSSGPGGQNVNKVSTAVELRFDLLGCTLVSSAVKERLRKLAGRSLTESGILILKSDRYRKQERNREDVRERLYRLIERALEEPQYRLPTSAPRNSLQQRRRNKAHRSLVKKQRCSKFLFDKE